MDALSIRAALVAEILIRSKQALFGRLIGNQASVIIHVLIIGNQEAAGT